MHRSLWIASSALALLASLALGTALQAPTTWVVDDDGGPGVDFTDLQQAINAAAAGDLILVKPGDYGDFDLGKSLTILGELGVNVGVGTVHDAGGFTALASFAFVDLEVRDCSGTVVLDELFGRKLKFKWWVHPELLLENCVDVRVIGLDSDNPEYGLFSSSVPSIIARASRVEITSSLLRGQPGNPNTPSANIWGDPGFPALVVEQGATVHMSRTSLTGGLGGYSSYNVNGYGGDGGPGIDIVDGTVLITGRGAEELRGGKGHGVQLYGYGGRGGNGVQVHSSSSVRYSKVKLIPGAGGSGGNTPGGMGSALSVDPGGSSKQAKLADPVLERLSTPSAGGTFGLKLRSKPGTYTRLFWGFTPIVKPSPGVLVDSLVMKEVTLPLGFVPASGVLVTQFTLDPGLPSGCTIFLQAMAVFPSGKIRRTNSVPVVVR